MLLNVKSPSYNTPRQHQGQASAQVQHTILFYMYLDICIIMAKGQGVAKVLIISHGSFGGYNSRTGGVDVWHQCALH